MKPQSLENIRSKVVAGPNGCHIWTGATGTTGYGLTTINDKSIMAHRAVLVLMGAEVPKGLHVDHLCRNIRCINPNHLEVVTPRENILRSDGPAAKNARKTHCKNGHALIGDNLEYYEMKKWGRRSCKTCRNANQLRRYHAMVRR